MELDILASHPLQGMLQRNNDVAAARYQHHVEQEFEQKDIANEVRRTEMSHKTSTSMTSGISVYA